MLSKVREHYALFKPSFIGQFAISIDRNVSLFLCGEHSPTFYMNYFKYLTCMIVFIYCICHIFYNIPRFFHRSQVAARLETFLEGNDNLPVISRYRLLCNTRINYSFRQKKEVLPNL